ncbi:MAG TPA: metallophosphoesterase [Actinomycetota bacterium]|jgi:Calcineurin-like phosphoesterase superfamily domain
MAGGATAGAGRLLARARPALARLRRPVLLLLPVAAGAVGAVLAITLVAREDARIGPASVRLSVRPALSGSSRLAVPPFGSVSARTHHGLLQFRATLDDVDVAELNRALNEDDQAPGGLRHHTFNAALAPLERDAREAARGFLLRVTAVGLLGGLAGVLLFARRDARRLALAAAGGVLATAVLLVPSVATYDVGAFRAPRYEGAVEYAPALVGDVRTGLDRLQTLRDEMALITANLNRAYAALGRPVRLDGATVRVLHVGDVHLNPAGFDLAQQLAEKFEVAAVVDSGDMGTWGLPPERAVTRRVRAFGVPYLFVKGNHDNPAMVAAIRANPNARVLDDSDATVQGIRFYGVADPVFSPGQGYRNAEFQRLKERRSVDVASELDARARRPDVLVVHDPALARYALGSVATVLEGHLHSFGTGVVNGTRELRTGTVGGAGPDGLRAKQPVPYTAEVLYFDPTTRRPVAVDRITVGALQSSFSVDRELLEEGATPFAPDPVQVPAELLPPPAPDEVQSQPPGVGVRRLPGA